MFIVDLTRRGASRLCDSHIRYSHAALHTVLRQRGMASVFAAGLLLGGCGQMGPLYQPEQPPPPPVADPAATPGVDVGANSDANADAEANVETEDTP